MKSVQCIKSYDICMNFHIEANLRRKKKSLVSNEGRGILVSIRNIF